MSEQAEKDDDGSFRQIFAGVLICEILSRTLSP